jgi:diguanylate cyclase (GGDEF)-like protein/PAS domain S-box-containing protein
MQKYLMAALIVIAAFLLRKELFDHFIINLPPFFTFYPAIVIVVLRYGLRPGLFSVGLSSLLVGSVILRNSAEPPRVVPLSSGVILALFIFICVFLCVATEIFRRDQLRLAELEKKEAVREHENLLQLFIDHAPGCIHMLDAGMILCAASQSWLEKFATKEYGLTRKQVMGRHYYELFPDLPESWKSAHCRALHGEFVRCAEDRIITKDGEEFWMNWQIVPWLQKSGSMGGMIIFSEDITERKLAEEALRVSEARYRTAFQASLDAFCIARMSDGMLTDVNQAFCSTFGFEFEEAVGHSVLELGIWVNLKDRESVFETLRQNQNNRNFQTQFHKKDGKVFGGLVSASEFELNGDMYVLSAIHDLSEAQSAQAEIQNLAFYDSLTGLANRRLFMEQLHKGMAISARNGHKGAVLFVDIDNFRLLNDTLGHEMGDEALRQLGQRLEKCVREVDTVSRLGGDEFAILMAELSVNIKHAAHYAKRLAERIVAEISRPLQLNGHESICSCCIGITIFDDHESTASEIMQRADVAMYQAKQTGRNTISFFSEELQTDVNARATAEAELRQGIRNNEFVLYYQPQIQFGRVAGVEALLRWNHPQRGLLPPGSFIEEAEETGLIIPLGEWVLETACKQIAAWAKDPQYSAITVAINVSALQMKSNSFVSSVLNAIERNEINPGNLELELTETLLFEDVEGLIAKMIKLKAHGVKFAIDDFGTGYSSLAYLKRFPVDHLKIDRSFVRDLPDNGASSAIVQAIISLGYAMGLSVIAEGVETEQQREYLTRLGCNIFQGYLFSRPLPVEQLELALPRFQEADIVVPANSLFSVGSIQ